MVRLLEFEISSSLVLIDVHHYLQLNWLVSLISLFALWFPCSTMHSLSNSSKMKGQAITKLVENIEQIKKTLKMSVTKCRKNQRRFLSI
jgi:hypothetical protein